MIQFMKLLLAGTITGAVMMTAAIGTAKHQFDALVHDESVGAESIDEIFDVQFRRRFTELINQTAQRTSTNVYNWPRRF